MKAVLTTVSTQGTSQRLRSTQNCSTSPAFSLSTRLGWKTRESYCKAYICYRQDPEWCRIHLEPVSQQARFDWLFLPDAQGLVDCSHLRNCSHCVLRCRKLWHFKKLSTTIFLQKISDGLAQCCQNLSFRLCIDTWNKNPVCKCEWNITLSGKPDD